jgi:Ca-activated chloride channel family protein
MLSFDWPMVFFLLPLPLLAYWLLPLAKQQQAAVRVPFYNELADLEHSTVQSPKNKTYRLITLIIIWLSLITAAASPKWIGDAIEIPTSGRDLLLAVDLSKSMTREDMVVQGEQTDRITAVKVVVSDFLERRKGDRIGLILFADQAYVQAPLTFDTKTVKRFLLEAQIGFAGSNTAIGDAIGLSVKRLRNRPGDKHVIILLTDGANTTGQVKPIAAAKLAARENIKIYAIGIGADEMVTPGLFGTSFGAQKINPSADLDEKTLQAMADMTGGKYFRARNPEELIGIYKLLDELEPIEDKKETFRPIKSLFYWPLNLALFSSMLMAITAIPFGRIFSKLTSNKDTDEGYQA